jgi:Domain of unknown function (DUF4783)
MMKLHFFLAFFVFYLTSVFSIADPIDRAADLIRQGNIHELSKTFSSNVEVTIHDEQNVYSRAQAELVLNKFFNENKLLSVKMLHKVNSNPNYFFGVLIIDTDKGQYRMALTFKQADSNLTLIEIRIETEKVK